MPAISNTLSVPLARIGIIVIDTGARITRFKYSDNVSVNDEDDNYVCIGITLKDLVKKAKCWPNYDRELMERYFIIKCTNSEIVTTLDKSDLPKFTINDILGIMNIDNGEFHIVTKTRH